jgi:hypothetical protein
VAFLAVLFAAEVVARRPARGAGGRGDVVAAGDARCHAEALALLAAHTG